MSLRVADFGFIGGVLEVGGKVQFIGEVGDVVETVMCRQSEQQRAPHTALGETAKTAAGGLWGAYATTYFLWSVCKEVQLRMGSPPNPLVSL